MSRSRGSFDYQGASRSRDVAGGGYELGLVGIHPYLAWSVLPDLEVWGTAGHAWGRLQIVDEQAGEFLSSPATLDSGMVGVSGRLLTRGATTLRLKGEWALAQMDVARAGTAFEAAIDEHSAAAAGRRGQSRATLYASGVSLTPWGELGLRHDGGDGETGAGLELGGGLRYLDREAGLTVEGHGRWLTVHRGTLREWGFGALVRFAPGTGGRGSSLEPDAVLGRNRERRAAPVGARCHRPAPLQRAGRASGGAVRVRFHALRRRRGAHSLRRRELGPRGCAGIPARRPLGGGAVGDRGAWEVERRERLAAAKVHALMLLGAVQF